MKEIYYNSDITPKAVNELKLLALYYDKIHIVNDAVYSPKFETVNGEFQFAGVEDLQFIPKSFKTDYKLLLDENIISITKREENKEDEYEKQFSERISKLLTSNHDLLFPKHPTKENVSAITEEVYDIMKYMIDFEWGSPIEVNFIWWYYALKLKWFLKLLIEGKTCISSSNNLNQLFSLFIKQSGGQKIPGYTKSLAYDSLKINLPNPDVLSFEDILELKLRLKDELELFRQTINSIEVRNKELLYGEIGDRNYEKVFFDEVQKPLKALELKMQALNSKTFREFLSKLQNPLSYAPLLGTIVASLPIEYTLMASMGLTTSESFIKYREEKKEIRSNGLYFLLKLKN